MMALADWQQRVVSERADLAVKVEALRSFFDGEVYDSLDIGDQILLVNQCDAMIAYRIALDARIATFPAA